MTDLSARAANAQRLMDDPVLTEAFQTVVNETMVAWAKSPPDNPEYRERLHQLVVAVDRVRGKLKSFVDDAKMAERAQQARDRLGNLGS